MKTIKYKKGMGPIKCGDHAKIIIDDRDGVLFKDLLKLEDIGNDLNPNKNKKVSQVLKYSKKIKANEIFMSKGIDALNDASIKNDMTIIK